MAKTVHGGLTERNKSALEIQAHSEPQGNQESEVDHHHDQIQ